MNDPLRILHVISRLDGYGGARLLRALAARQAGAGRRVEVAALATDKRVAASLRAAGVAVHRLDRRWRWDPIALGRLAKLRRGATYDVVHVWDDDARRYARAAGGGRLLAATVSPGAARAFAAAGDRAALLAELDAPADARLIAVAGPLVRRKEIDEAIWNFELVRVLHPEARLVVFGDGPDRARLERYARLVSAPGCVCFAGYRADLLELMPNVDVYWQLDGATTTPYAMLEALAAGVPVVASDVPALRATIEPDATGLVAPLRHRAAVVRATDRLLTDETLARRLAEAGRALAAAKWSLDARLVEFDELYRSACPRTATKG